MPRVTRKAREALTKAGIEPSPLKSIPNGTQPKKPRGNATEKRSESPPQFNLPQQPSQDDVVDATSPSQSPNRFESRSQSPQVPESRSTSPPVQQRTTRSGSVYNLRTTSRSASPGHQNADANNITKLPQPPRGKKAIGARASSKAAASRKTAAPKSKATPGASRTRRQEEPFTHQSAGLSATINDEQSANKQSLYTSPGAFPEDNQHIPLAERSYQQTPPSASTSRLAVPKSDRPIRSTEHSRRQTPIYSSRLTPTPSKCARESSTHPGADSTDDESAHQSKRVRQNNHTPIATPRYPPIERGTSVAEDFGLQSQKRPAVQYNTSRLPRESFHLGSSDEDGCNSEYEIDGEGYTQEQMRAAKAGIRAAKEKGKLIEHAELRKHFANIGGPRPVALKSKDTTYYTTEQGPAPSSSRPSTSISESSLIIPASLSGERMILTDPKIIDAVRSLAIWAMSNPADRVPDAEQMTALFEHHNTQEMVQVNAPTQPSGSQATPTESTTLDNASNPVIINTNESTMVDFPIGHIIDQDRAGDVSSDDVDVTMSGGLGDQVTGVTEGASEVHEEIQEPRAPAQESTPPPAASRTIFGTLKSALKTPYNYFTRSQQAGETTTNTRAETDFTFEQPSNVGDLPSPSPTARLGKTQSERKPKLKLSEALGRSQTPRRVLQPKTPLLARGVISEERIKQIQDEQDARKAAGLPEKDIFGGRRRQKSNAHHASVEDGNDEEKVGTPYQTSATTGDKRKRGAGQIPNQTSNDQTPAVQRQLRVRTPECVIKNPSITLMDGTILHVTNASGYFTVPYSPSNGDSDEEKEASLEPEKEAFKDLPGGWINDESPKGKDFDLSTIFEEEGSSITYSGTVFQQPALVQANINQGLNPLTPQSSLKTLPDCRTVGRNLFKSPGSSLQKRSHTDRPFSRNMPKFDPKTADLSNLGSLNKKKTTLKPPSSPKHTFGGFTDAQPASTPRREAASTAPHKEAASTTPYTETASTPPMTPAEAEAHFAYMALPGRTYGYDQFSSDDSFSDESDDGSLVASTPAKPLRDANNGSKVDTTSTNESLQVLNDGSTVENTTTKSLQQPSSVLQPKQWEQTPPKAPRPVNAQLPTMKYAPKKPSSLRQVSIMSPLQGGDIPEEEGAAEAASPPLINMEDVDVTMADVSELADWKLIEDSVLALEK